MALILWHVSVIYATRPGVQTGGAGDHGGLELEDQLGQALEKRIVRVVLGVG